MKPFLTLVRLYLNGLFRFSAIRYGKDPKERRQAILSIAAIAAIVVTYGGMSGVMTARLLSAGIEPFLPFLMIASMASLFTLAMAFAQGGTTLSGFADFDTLAGMPIKTRTIVLARFFALYLVEAIYGVAYLLPCGAAYALARTPVWWFYPVFLVMALLLPVVPIVLGSGVDLLLSAMFARSKYRKGMTSAIKMLFLSGFIIFAYLLPQMSDRFLAAPEKTAEAVLRICPPVYWFAKGASGDLLYAGLFTAVSIALCVLFILLLKRALLPLHDRLTSGYHVKNYHIGALKRSSEQKALFTVERKRFFGSTAWVVNTVIGSVLIAVLGIAAASLSGKLSPYLKNTAVKDYAAIVVTGVLTFCATVSPTTSCAISMEGKEIWIAKTMPVPARRWLFAKLSVNLLLVGPSLLLSIALIVLSYRDSLSFFDAAALILTPAAALLFTTVCGLYVNAKLPRLSWKSETEVVKQSGAVLVMMLIGFGLTAVCVIPALAIGETWVVSTAGAALLSAAAALFLKLMKNAEQIRGNL